MQKRPKVLDNAEFYANSAEICVINGRSLRKNVALWFLRV